MSQVPEDVKLVLPGGVGRSRAARDILWDAKPSAATGKYSIEHAILHVLMDIRERLDVLRKLDATKANAAKPTRKQRAKA